MLAMNSGYLERAGADRLVAVSSTEALAGALRAHSDAVETRIYAGRGHVDLLAALSLPARSPAPLLRDIAAFMQRLRVSGRNSIAFDTAPATPFDRVSQPLT
jgi:acetyl esterase/lipase